MTSILGVSSAASGDHFLPDRSQYLFKAIEMEDTQRVLELAAEMSPEELKVDACGAKAVFYLTLRVDEGDVLPLVEKLEAADLGYVDPGSSISLLNLAIERKFEELAVVLATRSPLAALKHSPLDGGLLPLSHAIHDELKEAAWAIVQRLDTEHLGENLKQRHSYLFLGLIRGMKDVCNHIVDRVDPKDLSESKELPSMYAYRKLTGDWRLEITLLDKGGYDWLAWCDWMLSMSLVQVVEGANPEWLFELMQRVPEETFESHRDPVLRSVRRRLEDCFISEIEREGLLACEQLLGNNTKSAVE
ncbi:MAG: hypothetical protein KDK78_07125 [Chlamydiia bacterium]|nr:hypothetical protein [Chlamydiia bacterium]